MKKISLLVILLSSLSVNAQLTEAEILKQRTEHEAELKDTSNHMLDSTELANFIGLDYFDFNEEYQIYGTFLKNKGKKFKMPTSTDRLPVYRRYGYITFKIGRTEYMLSVYQNMDLRKKKEYRDYLFIPFKDSTTRLTTYGGGRYLDARIPKGSRMLIDFNRAYNPYCAYSHHYSCPIPPEENTLPIPIEAGEKIPLAH